MHRKIFNYLFSFPADCVGWLTVLFLWACWGTKLRWQYGCLTCELKPGSWPMRTWYKGWAATCLGHAMFFAPKIQFGPGADTPTEVHELHHVRQTEAAMLGSFVVGLVALLGGCNLWVALAIWATGSLLMMLSSGVSAVLNGDHFYWGAHHEVAAYAVDGRGLNE